MVIQKNEVGKTNPKIISALKIIAVVVIGIAVLILLPANKIASSIVLTAMAIIILLPIDNPKWRWARIALILAMLLFVLHNISTTEYSIKYYHTGFKFLDQILYIF